MRVSSLFIPYAHFILKNSQTIHANKYKKNPKIMFRFSYLFKGFCPLADANAFSKLDIFCNKFCYSTDIFHLFCGFIRN